VFSASGGRINPGVSEIEAARNVLLRRIRRNLPGAHQIAVSSLKGGVGKTTVSAVLGLTWPSTGVTGWSRWMRTRMRHPGRSAHR